MDDFRLAAVTLTPQYHNVAGNRDAILAWSQRAADAGARLVVFPEGFLSGYDLDAKQETALPLDAAEIDVIAQHAESLGVIISFGLLERTSDGYFVTQVYVGLGIRLHHRKAHLTGWEKQHCLAGDRLEVQDLGFVKVGTLICYDSAFPAAAEALVRRGAELLIQPSCHGTRAADVAMDDRAAARLARREHIHLYWRARAYDYTCFALYVNHAEETSRGEWFPNYAGIFGPDGRTLAENTAPGEQMILADLSAAHLAHCRTHHVGHHFTLSDARSDLYHR